MTRPTHRREWMAILCAGERQLARFEKACMAVAGLTIITIMAFTVLDVILRYGFNSPLSWWFDVLMNYLLLAPFFLSFSYTLAQHGHLAVEFFSRRIHPPTLYLFLALAFAGSSAMLSAVTLFTFRDAYEAWLNDDVLAGVIPWPMWISKAVIAVGTLPLSLRCLHFAIGHALSIRDHTAGVRLGVVSSAGTAEEAL